MDYEKEYKEMVARAKELHESGNALTKRQMEIICPGLAESEDERIRKEIIGFIDRVLKDENVLLLVADKIGDDIPNMIPGWIAYLEKQKEQKPAEPSYDERQRHQDELYDFKVFAAKQAREHHIPFVHDFEWNNFCAELLSYFNYKKQKPVEWSEEDEVYLQDALWCVKQASKVARGENDMGACWSAERWLKSLRPQPHWNPSAEQMEALRIAYEIGTANESWAMGVLKSLYNDLKKL